MAVTSEEGNKHLDPRKEKKFSNSRKAMSFSGELYYLIQLIIL
jgi:hypothetical protein